MTLLEQIQIRVGKLPPEKQTEVLDFVAFLQERLESAPKKRGTLSQHPAFGLWKQRKVDGITYQQNLRSEWDV